MYTYLDCGGGLGVNIKDKLVYLSDTNSFFKKMKLYYWRCKDYPDQHNVEKMIKKRKRGYIDKKFATTNGKHP